jgi:hypothetical protein
MRRSAFVALMASLTLARACAPIQKTRLLALADNESAREVLGEPALRVIAHELAASIKSNVSVDWMHREAARARMRVLAGTLQRLTDLFDTHLQFSGLLRKSVGTHSPADGQRS